MNNQQGPRVQGAEQGAIRTFHRKTFWFGASALTLVITGAGAPAMAAEPAQTTASAASALDVGAVVVTARRRQENVQNVPISITALSGPRVTRDNSGNAVLKLAEKVPSITAFWSNPKQVLISLRGLGANAGNNDGLEPSVGLFIDGVYLARTGQLGFSGNFEDIADVQVLRGPQGTLFGKNTTAGAILINSNPPTFRPYASAELDYGNYNLWQVRGVASGPVIDDKLALRLSFYDNQRSGTFYNQTLHNTVNGLDNWGFKAQALYTPTSDLSVHVIYSRDVIGQAQLPSIYLGDGPVRAGGETYSARLTPLGYTPVANPFSYTLQQNAALYATASADALSAEVNWTFAGGYKLTSITAYRDYFFYPLNDFDDTPLPIETQGGTSNELRQYSQEFRVASPSEQRIFGQHIDWVAGLYLYQQRLTGVNRAVWGPDEYYIVTHPAGTTPASFNGVNYGYNELEQIKSYGLFGQANWHITDKLELTGGLRETWEEKSADTDQYITNPGGLTPAQVSSVFGVTFGTSGGSVATANLSWLASLSYKITPNVMVYGSAAVGQESAAANVGVFSPTQIDAGAKTIIPTEQTTSYEVGFKSTLFHRALQFNADLFDTQVTNYQTTIEAVDTTDPLNEKAVSFLGSVPGVLSQGAEVEASYTPRFIEGLDLNGGVSYDRAIYSNFPNAPCPANVSATLSSSAICFYNMTGKRVEQIPAWNVDLSADYSHPITDNIEGYAVAQWAWKSDDYLAAEDAPYGHVGPYGITNLRVGVRFDRHYDISIWVNNLTDAHYFVNTISATVGGAVRGTPGDPRTIGVSLKAHL
jgi:iron complex outermembrane receptor protein